MVTIHLKNVDELLTCYKGPLGNSLEHDIAVKTEALQPSHEYVPWIVSNGEHTDTIQEEASADLLQYVCDNYKGDHRAAACDEGKRPAVKRLEVCY